MSSENKKDSRPPGNSLFAWSLPLFLLASAHGFAQSINGAGSTSANFQKIGMGARGSAFGESYISVADDATAIFWNPAAMLLADGTQFSITHGEWIAGVTHEAFSFSKNLRTEGAFGGSLVYWDMGTLAGTVETSTGGYGGEIGNINASTYAGSAAFAQRLGNWFGGDFFRKSILGVKASVVGQSVVNQSYLGMAFDLGYLYEFTPKTFYLGGVAYNVGTQIHDFSQPLIFKLGGSYRFRDLAMKQDRLILAADTDGHIDTGFRVGGGGEYRMTFDRDDVAIRGGYRTGSEKGTDWGLTAGVGIAHRLDDMELALDYTFVPYGVLGDTHRISVNVALLDVPHPPKAFLWTPREFVLGKDVVKVDVKTKSEDPIEDWKITLTDSSGTTINTLAGKGAPPKDFTWDGKNEAGDLVAEGPYSFKAEVTDGNRLSAKSEPASVFARWVPKKVPYSYAFQLPSDVLFDSGKDELKEGGAEAIKSAMGELQLRYPEGMIVVAGHTDNVHLIKGAKFKDNQELSEARARTVMKFLIENGVDPQRLSIIGYGDTHPVTLNTTKQGKSKNRRVELVVSGARFASAEDMVQEGMPFLKEKKYTEALQRFQSALEADSRSGLAHRALGDCYFGMGKTPEAVAEYRKALEYNPRYLKLREWLDKNGEFYSKPQPPGPPLSPEAPAGGQTAPSLPVATPTPVPPASTGPQVSPAATPAPAPSSKAEGVLQEGTALLKAGNYAGALKNFQTALEVDPKNALAYRLEGECYFALGKKVEAVAAYRKAVEYNPDWARLKDWLEKYGDYYGKPGPANPPSTP